MRKMTVNMVYIVKGRGWERMSGFAGGIPGLGRELGGGRGDLLELRGYSPGMESYGRTPCISQEF